LCVLYNGAYLTNTKILPLDSLETALVKINANLVPLTGIAAPAINATYLGQQYLNTVTNQIYYAKSVGSGASDWTLSVNGTPGQVGFFGTTYNVIGDNGLFWDNTNKRLGVGTITPFYKFDLVGDSRLTGSLHVTGTFRDSTNSAGTAGQVLSSTVTGTDWISLPATPGLQAVLNAGNTATQNMSVSGKIYFEAVDESLDNFILYDPINGGNVIRYAADGGVLVLQENYGNVGIGIIPNSAKLDIFNTGISSYPHIKLTENVNYYSWGITNTSDDGDFIITDTEAANATKFHIQKGTGIVTVGGTPINSALLNVRGDGYFAKVGTPNVTIEALTAGNATLTLKSNTTSNGKAYVNASLSTGSLVLQTNTVDRVIVGNTGNVWIGATSSYTSNVAKLEVSGDGYFTKAGDTNITIAAQVAGSAKLTLASQSTGSNRAIINSSLASASLVLQTNSLDRVTIGSTGNTWIGGTTSFTGNTAKLEVTGSIASSTLTDTTYERYIFADTTGRLTYSNTYAIGVERVLIGAGGNPNAIATLEVNLAGGGESNLSLVGNYTGYPLLEGYQGPGVLVFYVADTGDFYGTSYNIYSDRTLKENIVPATSKLDDLMKVNVVNYNLINDKNKSQQVGVIAQEVEEIFPTLISEDKNGIKGVNVSSLIPILIKGMQEQQDIIKNLQTQIDELKNKIQ
jgi:hypothetical protein